MPKKYIRRSAMPAGKNRCSHCGLLKDTSEFASDKGTSNGLSSWCRECRRADGNPQRKLLQYDLQAYKQTHGCLLCGEHDPRALDFHHKDPGKKNFNVSDVWNKKSAEIWKEVEACIVLCKNCHRKLHRLSTF